MISYESKLRGRWSTVFSLLYEEFTFLVDYYRDVVSSLVKNSFNLHKIVVCMSTFLTYLS